MDNVVIEVPFGKIEIVDNCVIHTAHEGADIGLEEVMTLERVINEHAKGEIGYISNQVNDYSISAVHVAMFFMNNPRIRHVAFACYANSLRTAFSSIQRLVPENMLIKLFDNIEDAKTWIKKGPG